MLLESVIICSIILIISYRRHHFDFKPFNWLPLLFIGFIVEFAAAHLIDAGYYYAINVLTPYIQVVVYACLFGFVLKNIKTYKTIVVLGFGFLLNAIVIFTNGGRMPVDTTLALKCGFIESLNLLQARLVFGHQTLTATANFASLADVISIYQPYLRPQTISIGDIIIDIGLMLLTLELIRKARKV